MEYKCSYFSKQRILISLIFGLFILTIVKYSIFIQENFSFKREKLFYLLPIECFRLSGNSLRGFIADIFYIKGILAISDRIYFKKASEWIEWVQKNFEIAVSLDPYLVQGYFFAGIVVGRNKEGIKRGIDFLKKGLKLNPYEWRIPYWIGFNYYQLGEFLKAAYYYKKASILPNSPKFLKSNVVMFYYQAQKPELGIVYLEGLLKSVRDPAQLKWIKRKLEWLKKIVFLEEKVKEFKKLYQRFPQSLEELVEKGLIKEIPKDTFGKGYYLDQKARIRSKF